MVQGLHGGDFLQKVCQRLSLPGHTAPQGFDCHRKLGVDKCIFRSHTRSSCPLKAQNRIKLPVDKWDNDWHWWPSDLLCVPSPICLLGCATLPSSPPQRTPSPTFPPEPAHCPGSGGASSARWSLATESGHLRQPVPLPRDLDWRTPACINALIKNTPPWFKDAHRVTSKLTARIEYLDLTDLGDPLTWARGCLVPFQSLP